MSLTVPPAADAADPGSPGPVLPSPGLVVLLQSVRGYPAVSVLSTTTPAPVMTPADAARLHALVRQAGDRIRAEAFPGAGATLPGELERLAAEAATGPTGTAIALYASQSMALAVRLPVSVRDRVVVDPTFATRDLVRALHRTPRHVVLLLGSGEARLFDGVAETLRPSVGSAFPLRRDRQRRSDPSRPGLHEADTVAFLRTVDRALGTYLRLHPAPLVVAGDRTTAAFTRLSSNLGRLAGTVRAALTDPLEELARQIKPVLEAYLLSRQQEALDLLDRRAGRHQVVSGMASVWLAARREPPEMLAVEQGYFQPARLSTDGDLLQPTDDVGHPEVLDDAVDELIELVLDRGGWVALVEDGLLADHEGVAMTLRG